MDATGSTVAPGRFHDVPPGDGGQGGWPALYTSLDLGVAVGEIVRNDAGERLKDINFTEIRADLHVVAYCRDIAALGIDADLLLDDWDFSVSHALAHAVREGGAEATLVPSASRLGDNLVIFPDRLRPGSTLVVVRTLDPSLVKVRR